MGTAIVEAAIGFAIFVPLMLVALWLVAKRDAHNVFSLLLPAFETPAALSGLLLTLVLFTIALSEGFYSPSDLERSLFIARDGRLAGERTASRLFSERLDSQRRINDRGRALAIDIELNAPGAGVLPHDLAAQGAER
jgi:hypothetical protein